MLIKKLALILAIFSLSACYITQSAEDHYQLGKKYQHGDGVEKDYDKAVEYYTLAAYRGHVEAQVFLGDMYSLGNGAIKNKEKAVQWYQKACDQQSESACEKLKMISQ